MSFQAVVIGVGAVGARAARQLVSTELVTTTAVADIDNQLALGVSASLGPGSVAVDYQSGQSVPGDVVVLAGPVGTHLEAAKVAIANRQSVVSVSDCPSDAAALLALDADAKAKGVTVVAGAGFMPGLSCVLVRHAAAVFDQVEEIHVAKSGAGGPACARQYHAALGLPAQRWDAGWRTDRGGSGRELMWFPDPVGSQDCYRGALADAVLLRAAFPETERIDARMAANRRDRLTMRLPMLSPPHSPEGGIGAVRIEVWGRRGVARDVVVMGAVDRPSVAAGAVAAVSVMMLANRETTPTGAHSVASFVTDSVGFLAELARRGVRAAVFEGERSALAPPLEPKS